MEKINDFNIYIDKIKVLNAINSYYQFQNERKIINAFNNYEKFVMDIIKPSAYFSIEAMPLAVPSDMLKECSSIVYTIITIGDTITTETDKCFEEGDFEKGLILDALSTHILFDLSNQLNDRIFKYTSANNLGLTCRIAPGDGEIDIKYQKYIVNKFVDNKIPEFSIADNYLITPYKSLCYVFGADEHIPLNKLDHHCDQCSNVTCIMRNSSKRIRGPFKENE